MKTTQTTNTAPAATPTKAALMEALHAFISQRSGIDYANYGERAAFMGDYRPILREGREARMLLRSVELRDSITAQDIIEASERAFSGRLRFRIRYGNTSGQVCADCGAKPGAAHKDNCEGGSHDLSDMRVAVDYCTGQYFPTEYRAAACAVLAAVLWSYFRANMPQPDSSDREGNPRYAGLSAGDYLRKQARREFGRGITSRWFN